MKQLHVGTSMISGTIYAGAVLQSGRRWAANKQDVTLDALVAVAQHVVRFGEPVEITDAKTGALQYRITVEEFKEQS